MLRKLHTDHWDLADSLLAGLAGAGYWLEPGSKILDFGCGAGALVYRFRELGFEAYGFDIHNCLALRDPADIRFFGFAESLRQDTSNMMVDWERFKDFL